MQATSTVSQVGMQVLSLGYRTPSLLLLNTNHSRFLTFLAQHTSSCLLPTALTLSLEIPLQPHHSFTLTLCLSFELELLTCPDQRLVWAGPHCPWPLPWPRLYQKHNPLTRWQSYFIDSIQMTLSAWMPYFRLWWSKGRREIIRKQKEAVCISIIILWVEIHKGKENAVTVVPLFYRLAHCTVPFRYCTSSPVACK